MPIATEQDIFRIYYENFGRQPTAAELQHFIQNPTELSHLESWALAHPENIKNKSAFPLSDIPVYVRQKGGIDVYDISSGQPRHVSYNEAQKNNIWGQIQEVNSLSEAIEQLKAANPMNAILDELQKYLDELKKRGQVINPNIEITPDKAAEFLAQAEREISPYYQTQLKLARESLLAGLGYTKDQILAQEAEYERKYGKSVRALGEEMAERGYALSGQRRLQERELAEETQRMLEQARKEASYKASEAGRQFAQLWGQSEVPVPTLPAVPTVKAGKLTFERTGQEIPFYELSPEVYSGLIGEKQYEEQMARKTRAAELEKAFREQQLINQYRSLTI